MVYIRKKRKRLVFRAVIIFLAAAFLLSAVVRAVNAKLDDFIITLARTGLTGEITRFINEAIAEVIADRDASALAEAVCDASGSVRFVRVDSLALSALRANISLAAEKKLSALAKFYVTADLSNVLEDEILFGKLPINFTVDVITAHGVQTDVKSEFISVGINQTNYRLSLTVAASVTADVISSFTVDVYTSVNLVDMLIISDVPTVTWG